jgi:hypothetical protein
MNALEKARTEYLQHYRAAIARNREANAQFAPEILLELSDSVGLHRKLYRVDMISTNDGKHSVIEANLDRATQFAETMEQRGETSVTLRPFVWNGVMFITQGGRSADVDSWFLRWADIDDNNESDEDGLGCVIHSLKVTDLPENGRAYSVDFGSAPVDSFVDFLDVLARSGATTIDVSSPHFEFQEENPFHEMVDPDLTGGRTNG